MVTESNSTHSQHSLLKRSLLVVGVSLGLGLAFDYLFVEKIPGISFPLYVVVAVVSLLLAARWQGKVIAKSAYWMLPPLLFLSGMVFVRAGDFVAFLNAVASLYLLALFVTLAAKPRLRGYNFANYMQPLALPALVIEKCKATLSHLAVGRSLVRKHQALPQVLRGVLIALPVLLVFVALFASADLVFREYVSDIFSFNLNGELVVRGLLVLAVAAGFTGLLGAIGEKPKELKVSVPATGKKRDELIEATILFGSLNVLFLSFIVIQVTYLFGGVENVLASDGFSYAEYARRGFFELIVVAGLSLLLIFATERLLQKQRERHAPRFKFLAGALIVQVMVVMVSAFKRMQLYEGAYGFTTPRLFGYIGIIWLAVVFGLLLYKIVADKKEHMLAFGMFMSVLAVLVGLNLLNPDGYVARKNIERYHKTGKLDLAYLDQLSDNATTQTAKLLNVSDPQVKDNVAAILYWKRQAMLDAGSPWQSANLARQDALRTLNAEADLLEQQKDRIIELRYVTPQRD